MENAWESGTTPWLRREQPKTTWGTESQPAQCMFCGARTVKRSGHDKAADHGRLELYCDNGDCDAREVIVLVRRDGGDAVDRADVRALAALDQGLLDIDEVEASGREETSAVLPTLGYVDLMSRKPGPTVERRTALPKSVSADD